MGQYAGTAARDTRRSLTSFYNAPIKLGDRPVEIITNRALAESSDGDISGVHTNKAAASSAYHAAPELRPLKQGAARNLTVVKEWEGVVNDIGISHFIANLVETRGGHDEIDVAEIPISDIPREYRDNLKLGAIFRYLVGYSQNAAGTVTKQRLVYFRKGRGRRNNGLEQNWLDMMACFKHDSFAD